jgi:molybdopterin-guanine dinucleotide biosynthesis protein A
VLRGADQSAARWHPDRAPALEEALASLGSTNDLVLVEGHKGTELPKLWLLGEDESRPPADVSDIRKVLPRGESRLPAALDEISGFLHDAWRRRPILGGILIGGGSTRMGRPKHLLKHRGRSFVESVDAALSERVADRVLLGSGSVPNTLSALDWIPDPPGVTGPIAGLLAALRWAPGTAWIVAACDQPLVTVSALDWLVAQRRPGRWAVLPRPPGRPVEPFLAVYEPQALPLLERLAGQDPPAPRLLAEHPKVLCPEPHDEIAECWRSVNTPEEFEALGDED